MGNEAAGKGDEDCNVVIQDDDNGSFMPLSHADADGSFGNDDGSIRGDEEDFDELPDVEDEQHITIEEESMKTPDRFRRKKFIKNNDYNDDDDNDGQRQVLNSEEIVDDDEEDSTPHKNMQAIGHIGPLSVRADSVKNRTEHGGSSIGISRRSNSLARNMNSFLMSRHGPN